MCIGTDNNNGNGDDQIVPCMPLGTTPNAQLDLGFLNYKKRISKLYRGQIRQSSLFISHHSIFDTWWHELGQDVESFPGSINGSGPCPNSYEDLIDTYNMNKMFLLDYNGYGHK